MREGQPHVIHLKDYEVPGYLIEHTALDVESVSYTHLTLPTICSV